MNSPNNQPPSGPPIDPASLSMSTILKALTPTQIGAMIASLSALCVTAYALGITFDPRANDLSAENGRLRTVIDATQISADQTRSFPLKKFLAGPTSDLSTLESRYGGKLYAPRLDSDWVPYAANDLSLLADLIGAPRATVKSAMPLTYDFNEKNPPQIWTVPHAGGDQSARWLPYIQISLIPRSRAQQLMEAVNTDGFDLIKKTKEAFLATLQSKFSSDAMKLVESKVDRIADTKFLAKTFFNGSLSEAEMQVVFGLNSSTRQEKINAIAAEMDRNFDARFRVPSYLLQNGMGSLGNVTPEAGLLFGRLLFYVFGVAEDGRVDINQLVIAYEGSYAQLSRTIETADPQHSGAVRQFVVTDDVLILATKSDFCLIHIRIPEINDQLKQLGTKSREWLMQVRMRESR